MSRWYPIAATVEECRVSLAELDDTADKFLSRRGEKIVLNINHGFDRLQLWCFNFDVDSYGLDRKLRQSASLSEMVLDLLDKLKYYVNEAKKKITPRHSISDDDIDSARQSLTLATRVIDLLFELSGALVNPAFNSNGKADADHNTTIASLQKLPLVMPQEDHGFPTPKWRTAIFVNATRSCCGSRWEEVGALLTHLLKLLARSRRNISFVQLSRNPGMHDYVFQLHEAVEYIRNNQPTDRLLDATIFEPSFSTILSQLQESNIEHTSLIFVVPDGVIDTNITKIQRVILQKCKLIRKAKLDQASLAISFVVIEPTRFVLEPLIKMSLNINSDRAVLGTVLIRVIPYYMLSASEDTYNGILQGGVMELEDARRNAEQTIYHESLRVSEDALSYDSEDSSTIEVSGISPYTLGKTLTLEFERFGAINSTVIKYSDADADRSVVYAANATPRHYTTALDNQLDNSTRHRETKSPYAIIEYRRSGDASFARSIMNDTLFDSTRITVNLVPVAKAKKVSLEPKQVELRVREEIRSR